MHSASLFTNPYAVEVLQTKKKDLVNGINNTEHLLDHLIGQGILPLEKKLLLSNYRTREEKNSRILEILVSKGERACRLFFYPCLKLVEPALYNSIRVYVSSVNENIRDATRQLVGYLLEKETNGPPEAVQETPKKTIMAAAPLKKEKPIKKPDTTEKSIRVAGHPKVIPQKPGGLFEAAAAGDVSYLEEILKVGNVNTVNSSHETLLHIAASHGQVQVIEYLLSKGAKLDVRDKNGSSPLHRAAERGHAQAVKVLLEAGANIYATDKKSKTPFHLAAQNNHLSIVTMLVQEETRNYKNQKNFLHLVALKDESSLAQILLKKGAPVDAKDEKKKTSLFHAVSLGFEKTVKVLLEAGAQIDSSVIDAAFNSNNQLVFGLILQHAEDLSPDTRVSALFKAVQRDLHGIIAALIDKGTDVNARNDMQYTPLLLAAEMGKLEAIKVLVSRQARLDDKLPNLNTALHLAVQSGSLPSTKLLLEKGMDANTAGPGDQSPLHVAAFHNKPALVELLIKAGANVNAATKESLTPLHVACQWGHADVTQRLIQCKADINAKDKHSKTPLHFAAAQGNGEMVKQLLKSHADPNSADKEKKTPLHVAATEGHLEAVSAMLAAKARFGAKDMDGCTALHYAAAKGHASVATGLLAAGKNKNVDDKNVWRRTPLHLAAEHGQDALIELLLGSGAAVNPLDNNKDTPLHCACKSAHYSSVQKLVSWTQGEKPNLQATNNVKKTPLQVAQSGDTHNHQHIATFLKKKMLLMK
ncbi:UNVERIFIED_CONTAM: hypothetical protein FKN15_038111 [Acipenser sinensis]